MKKLIMVFWVGFLSVGVFCENFKAGDEQTFATSSDALDWFCFKAFNALANEITDVEVAVSIGDNFVEDGDAGCVLKCHGDIEKCKFFIRITFQNPPVSTYLWSENLNTLLIMTTSGEGIGKNGKFYTNELFLDYSQSEFFNCFETEYNYEIYKNSIGKKILRIWTDGSKMSYYIVIE